MELKTVENWFTSLRTIWLAKDVKAVRGLLSTDFQYYENPFEKPLTTWEEVEREWQVIQNQDIVSLKIDPLLVQENEGTATYAFCLKDERGVKHVSLGVYFVRLDQEGKATEFRQWWMNQ